MTDVPPLDEFSRSVIAAAAGVYPDLRTLHQALVAVAERRRSECPAGFVPGHLGGRAASHRHVELLPGGAFRLSATPRSPRRA